MADYLPPLTALRIFQRVLGEGSIILTNHVKEQMNARNFDMLDVCSLKDTGYIQQVPERDIKTGEWKYTIKGNDIEGEKLSSQF